MARECLTRGGDCLLIASLVLVATLYPQDAGAHSNASRGVLRFLEAHRDEVVRSVNHRAAIAVSPDGRNVYATRPYENAVLVYRREGVSGLLTLDSTSRIREMETPNGRPVQSPNGLILSPCGRHLYVSCSQAICIFDRDMDNGRLLLRRFLQHGSLRVIGPYGLAVSPDGEELYVCDTTDNSILVMSRDRETGDVALVQVLQDIDGGTAFPNPQGAIIQKIPNATVVDGLRRPTMLAVTPDGKQIVVASFKDNALSVFARDNQTGRFLPHQLFAEGPRCEYGAGLVFAQAVAISPDNRNAYVASIGDALASFCRKEGDDRWTFARAFRNGFEGVDGLKNARSVVVSPAGDYVYVVGCEDNAIAVFQRDATKGDLSFVEAVRGDDAAGRPFTQPSSVAVSPDGRHVYAASRDYSVIVFEVQGDPR